MSVGKDASNAIVELFEQDRSKSYTVKDIAIKHRLSEVYACVLLKDLHDKKILLRTRQTNGSYRYRLCPKNKPIQHTIPVEQDRPILVAAQPASPEQMAELNKIAELFMKVGNDIRSRGVEAEVLKVVSKKIDDCITAMKTIEQDMTAIKHNTMSYSEKFGKIDLMIKDNGNRMNQVSDYVASMKTTIESLARRLAFLELELGV